MAENKKDKNSQIDSLFDFDGTMLSNDKDADGFYDELDDFSFERSASKNYLYEDEKEEELSFSNGVFDDDDKIYNDTQEEVSEGSDDAKNNEAENVSVSSSDEPIKKENKKGTHFSAIMPVLERNRRNSEKIVKQDESFESDFDSDFVGESDIFGEDDEDISVELEVSADESIIAPSEEIADGFEFEDVDGLDSFDDVDSFDDFEDDTEIEVINIETVEDESVCEEVSESSEESEKDDAEENIIDSANIVEATEVVSDTVAEEVAEEVVEEVDEPDEAKFDNDSEAVADSDDEASGVLFGGDADDEETEFDFDDFDNDFDDAEDDISDEIIETNVSEETLPDAEENKPISQVTLFRSTQPAKEFDCVDDETSEEDAVSDVEDDDIDSEINAIMPDDGAVTAESSEQETVSTVPEEAVQSSTPTPKPKKKQPQSEIAKRKAERAKLRKKRKKRKKLVKDVIKETISWVSLVIAAFVVAFFVNLYIARPSIVSGTSMLPTLNNGDTVIISQIPYMLGEPQYGDIVVIDRNTERERTFAVEVRESLKYNALTQSLFSENELHEDVFWIKRIVGLPGDVIEFKDGMFIRNGLVIQEDYILTQDVTTYIDGSSFVVKEGCVFVMGDNRNGSHDSRFLSDQIELDHIVGKLISK